jgi:hypothetical protein
MILKSILVLFTALLSSVAQAHPGHDHGHWLSEPIHVLTTLAIISVVIVTAIVVRRVKSKNSEEK